MFTLLIIENDVNLQRLYTQEFIEEGYRVLSATNSNEAWTLLEQDPPDIAILDLIMPGMDGIAILERLVGQAPQLPVVINTAYPVYQNNYLTWSADAYVVKSSDLTELKMKIQAVLFKKHNEHQH